MDIPYGQTLTDMKAYIKMVVSARSVGLEATFATIEKNISSKDKFHINVYGTRKSDGKHIQLTKDHIYPRALGGLDIMKNYQTLCAACNAKKNNTPDMSAKEAIAAGLTTQEIQDKLAIVLQAREEFKIAEQKLQQAKAEFNQVLPKRDKSEFK